MIITCEIIRDMLPLYHDRCASSETKQLISLHLKDCADCKNYYKTAISRKKQLPNAAASENLKYKKIAKKMKKTRMFKNAVLGACLAVAVGAVLYVLSESDKKLF